MKSIDFVQALLILAFDIDWIRDRALELAYQNKNNYKYWTMKK